jgi:hypothetical protein
MRTETPVLAAALNILANDVQSADGVANAAIAEAAERLLEQRAALQRLTALYESENEPWPRPVWLRQALD